MAIGGVPDVFGVCGGIGDAGRLCRCAVWWQAACAGIDNELIALNLIYLTYYFKA